MFTFHVLRLTPPPLHEQHNPKAEVLFFITSYFPLLPPKKFVHFSDHLHFWLCKLHFTTKPQSTPTTKCSRIDRNPLPLDPNARKMKRLDQFYFQTCLLADNPFIFSGMCSFCRNFAKLCDAPLFWKNVHDSFSCFCIEIAYSSLTFCGAYMLSFLAHHTVSAKRAHPS